MKKNENILCQYFKALKNSRFICFEKRILLLLLGIQLLFSSLVFSQNHDSFVLDSLKALKIHAKGVRAGRLGDYEAASNYFNQVYVIYQKLYGNQSVSLVSPLINLGIQYKNQRNLDKAIEVYKKAETLLISKFGDSYPLLGSVYSNIGNIYSLTGDYNKALDYQLNAYRILRKDSILLNNYFQSVKSNIAEIQLKLGKNNEAIRFTRSNLKTTLPRLKPSLFDIIALAYRNEGEFDLSEEYYLSSIKSWIDLYGEANVELVDEYLAYSSFLLSQKQFEKAFLYTNKAQTIVLHFYGEKSTAFSQVQTNFGDYYYFKNMEAQKIDDFRSQQKTNLNQAIQYYQNGIISLVGSFDVKNPMVDPPLKNIISEIQLVDILKKKALAMEKIGDVFLSEFNSRDAEKYFIASISSLSKATQLIHRLRIGFENEDSKLFFSKNQESTFFDAVRISYKLFKQTKNEQYVNMAFEFSERSKASNLLASVKDIKAREFGGIPDSLLKREDYLRNNVSNYTSMLFEENNQQKPDSQKVNLYSSKIFKLDLEYDQLIKYFEKSYPEYYSFKYENKITDIGEIQSKLSSRDALIEFVVDEPVSNKDIGELYRFVVTKDGVDFSMECIDSSYEKNIDFVHSFLTNTNYLFTKKRDFVQYSVSGYHLYEKLLKPVSYMLEGKNLTIIPDDKLSYIPFDALLSQLPDTSIMDFRNLNYLVHNFAISYSYSATLKYNLQDNSKRSSKSLIAFSPQYIVTVPRIDKESSREYFFAPLSGAKEEVKNLSSYIKTVAFIDSLAQESTFKEKAPNFDILHLAMHTIINDSLPMFSKLVFSDPGKISTDDGFLNTYEIYNMKLHARLAVLSACETGSGKLQKGEGVMSLARGFIYAGCPSIVMTLWQVEDKSGVDIMKNFYSYLSKGKRKDVALQMAKLKHLEFADPLMAHPHYWLGYVNIGNPDSLFTSKDVYFIIFLFIAIIAVYIDWFHRKKKPRKIRG
jgi:CHAT domain-containing protein